MKRNHKIVLCLLVLLFIVVGVILYNNKKIVRTVKSEHQLMEIYKSKQNLTTMERLLTMPFSLFIGHHIYYDYNRKYYDGIEIADDASESSGSTKDYSKTNIQVEGVDEADIIKTDGDYIYSISGNNIVISNVKDPNNVVIESKTYIGPAVPNDLLLYENYLIVISYVNSSNWYNQNTLVSIYNISDRHNPKQVKSFELYEGYNTSRCIDGNLYIFANGYLREENDKIVRKYKEDNITKEINLDDIKYIKNNKSKIQTLIAHLDLNNLNSLSVQSYLIDISNAYVSQNNIYLLDDAYDDQISISSIFTLKGVIGFLMSLDDYDYSDKTKIYKFEIDKNKGVVFNNVTTIEGSIVNQYSLDEKDNNLRIALETDEGTRVAILNDKLKIIGQTDKVAEGERMYASRFIGDKAYLVTYRNTDPLFVVDLSNPNSPKIMGELKIPGYSTYLHPYDETHLIGIGMDTEEVINRDINGKVISTWVNTKGMKMCLFDVSDISNPKEIAKTTIGDSRTISAILTNPKALLFSKEKKLLAIPVNNYADEFSLEYSEDYSTQTYNYKNYNKNYIAEGYFVYNIDLSSGFNLKGIITHERPINYNYYYYRNNESKLLRGIYIDNNLYTVSERYIKVNDLNNLSEISSLAINGGL